MYLTFVFESNFILVFAEKPKGDSKKVYQT